MLTIEIHDAPVEQRTTNNGKQLWVQTAYAHTVDRAGNPHKYPSMFTIDHWDPADVIAPGKYVVAPSSFYIGKFKQLELSRSLKLTPVK